jgi:hypothetical protein
MSQIRISGLILATLAIYFALASTAAAQVRQWRVSDYSAATVVEWTDTTAKVIEASGFSPPVAARLLGYVHLAAFEAAVPGTPNAVSMSGRIGGLAAHKR